MNKNEGKRTLLRWDHPQIHDATTARSKQNSGRGKSIGGSYPNKGRQKTSKTPLSFEPESDEQRR